MSLSGVEIVILSECSLAKLPGWLAQAEAVFFQTANKGSFGSTDGRLAFFNRWFGHYTDAEPSAFLLAIGPDGDVAGYLAGCIDSFSATSAAIIGDIDYFTPAFCAALKSYPSHFHINVRPGNQGKGVGRQLVAKFAGICTDARSPGIHVATGASSRAASFYEACGFKRLPPFPAADPGLAVLVCAMDAPQKGQMPT